MVSHATSAYQSLGQGARSPWNRIWDDVACEIAVRRSTEGWVADHDAGRTYTSEALLESLGLTE